MLNIKNASLPVFFGPRKNMFNILNKMEMRSTVKISFKSRELCPKRKNIVYSAK